MSFETSSLENLNNGIEGKDSIELKSEFISKIKSGYARSISRKEYSDDLLNSPEVMQAIKEGCLSDLRRGEGFVYNNYSFDKDFLDSSELLEAAKDGFSYHLNCGYLSDAQCFYTSFKIPKSLIEEEVKDKFLIYFDGDNMARCSELGRRFDFVLDDYINSEEGQKIGKRKFGELLEKDDVYNASKVEEFFKLSFSSINFTTHSIFINKLDENLDTAIEIKKKYNIKDSSDLSKVIERVFSDYLKKGFIDNVSKMKENFNLSEEFLNSPEVLEASEHGFINNMERGLIKEAVKTMDSFTIKDEVVQEETQSRFICHLEEGRNLIADEIKSNFNLSEEFLNSPEVLGAIKNCFYLKVLINQDDAIKFKDDYNLKINIDDLMEQPRLKKFFDEIKEKAPSIYLKCSSSIDNFIDLIQFIGKEDEFIKIINDYPFLEDAVINNKYGKNLLLKFTEFSKDSKENIKSLFDWKMEILSGNPSINENSPEFRGLMQEKIKLYKNNPKIIKDLKEEGIDTENWLNYKEEDNFVLKEGELIDFSKIIETPLNRINESVFKYIDNINLVFGDFTNELKNHETYSDEYLKSSKLLEDIKKKINDEKINSVPNQERIRGMEKGVIDLTQKLEKMKDNKISLYDKIQLKLSSLNANCEEVKKINEELIILEGENNVNPSKEISNKISKIKESLKKKFFSLKDQFEYFSKDSELSGTVYGFLGKDRVDAIYQELEEALNENFNHMETDIADLSRIFTEKQKENDIEGRKMGINVWNRNPNVDLYQGNYSPCCISIESGSGSNRRESAISDYMTDLAIQIVNITDKEKNIPIVAAWCWLGKDKAGNKCFVIDNIEANTDYTNKYPQLLGKKLENYIKKYAESLGFDEEDVLQGEYNNDLKLGFNSPNNKNIIKIGPNNRPGRYYLEAEGK
jgi:hypothetical protein